MLDLEFLKYISITFFVTMLLPRLSVEFMQTH